MKYFALGFVAIFAGLMLPSLLIDLGAFMADEVKMPLGSLILIQVGCYFIPAFLVGLGVSSDHPRRY